MDKEILPGCLPAGGWNPDWNNPLPKKFIFTFNEEKYVNELLEYIMGTYNQHYIGGIPGEEKHTQTTERIIQNGYGTGFCMGNVGKYVDRYGKKDGYKRSDLLKLLHYALIQLFIHDKENLEGKKKGE